MLRPIALAVLTLLPVTAQAANGLRPRTPAEFGEVPCVSTESVGTVVHFEYSVPFDDTLLSSEELPDSRTMQFFAIRHVAFDYALPVYISQDDFDRAEANNDNTKPYSADDILHTASAWPSSEWIAITPDDARVPITVAQAAMGVDWDTTGVAPGTWVIVGYTFEPENNLWSYRLGAVRLVDPADPDAAGPAAFFVGAIDAPAATVGTPYAVTGCILSAPGSTYAASLGILDGIDEPTWDPFVDDAEAQDGELALSLVAPSAASGKTIKVRLDVTDPNGRSYVAYSPYPVLVFGDGGEDGGSSGDGTGDGTGQDDGGGRCGVGGRTDPIALLALLCLGARPRRRSSSERHDVE